MEVNRIIANIMDREGVSQKKLADRMGISRQAVSQMVNGNDMKVSTFLALLSALGYTVQVMRGDESDA